LIRIACSTIWTSAPVSDPSNCSHVVVENFIDRRDQIKADIATQIQDILLSLVWWYPALYDTLISIANGDKDNVQKFKHENPIEAQLFYNWGILDKNNDEFEIKDLSDFITANGPHYKTIISPFARGDLNINILPKIPDIDLLSRLFTKKVLLESQLRRVIVLHIAAKNGFKTPKIAADLIKALDSTKKDKKNASRFIGRVPADVINEYFTLELKDTILFHWQYFAELFQNKKQLFEMNMDTVNLSRRYDSHSKPISEQETLAFETSYNWLLSCLAPVQEWSETQR